MREARRLKLFEEYVDQGEISNFMVDKFLDVKVATFSLLDLDFTRWKKYESVFSNFIWLCHATPQCLQFTGVSS